MTALSTSAARGGAGDDSGEVYFERGSRKPKTTTSTTTTSTTAAVRKQKQQEEGKGKPPRKTTTKGEPRQARSLFSRQKKDEPEVASYTAKPKQSKPSGENRLGKKTAGAEQKPERTPFLQRVFTRSAVALGVVHRIKDLEAVVAFPFGQYGTVSITEISPHLTSLVEQCTQASLEDQDDDNEDELEVPKIEGILRVGQPVLARCLSYNVGTEAQRFRYKAELTLLPRRLYQVDAELDHLQESLKNIAKNGVKENEPGVLAQGTVKSKEDYGYLIDLGYEKNTVTAFLPKSEEDTELAEGQVVLVKLHSEGEKIDFDQRSVLKAKLLPSSDTAVTEIKKLIDDKELFIPSKTIVESFSHVIKVKEEVEKECFVQVGEVVRGTVVAHSDTGCVHVELGDDKHRALIPSLHTGDVVSSDLETNLKTVRAKFPLLSRSKFRVLSVEKTHAGFKVAVTAKKTLVQSDLPIIKEYSEANVDKIVDAVVVKVLPSGLIVQFYNKVSAFLPARELSYNTDCNINEFTLGQPLRVRILSVQEDRMRASLKLEPPPQQPKKTKEPAISKKEKKASETEVMKTEAQKEGKTLSQKITEKFDFTKINNNAVSSVDDAQVGQSYEGVVVNVKDGAGVFVALGPNVTGRIKIGNLSDSYVKNWQELYRFGMTITSRVIHKEGTRIELSRKTPKHKKKQQEEEEEEKEEEQYETDFNDCLDKEANQVIREMNNEEPVEPVSLSLKASGFSWPGDNIDVEEEKEEEEEEEEEDAKVGAKRPRQKKPEGFEKALKILTSSKKEKKEENEYEAVEVKVKLSKRQALVAKNMEAKERDMAEIQREHELLSDVPRTVDDFERLLVGESNRSDLWIGLMALHVQSGDIARARSVAERALRRISVSEDAAREDMWKAWVNLEHAYGKQEDVKAVFHRALEYAGTNQESMYVHIARMYARSGHEFAAQATAAFKELTKKFKTSTKAYCLHAEHLYRSDRAAEARELLQVAQKSLPKKSHVECILRFAGLEYRAAKEPARGRTLFETLVVEHPNRTDVWRVYADMEASVGNIEGARRVYERVCSLKFSARKMQKLLKRYLDFEKKHGTEKHTEHVKQLAEAYVNSRAQAEDDEEEEEGSL